MNKFQRLATVLALLMLATALLSWLGRPTSQVAKSRADVPLEAIFPAQVGPWQLDAAAQALVRPSTLRAQDFEIYSQVLERTYINPQGERLMLSVAYGINQSPRLQVHKPEVCYKSSGYSVDSLHHDVLRLPGLVLPMTRLHAHMDGRSEPISYWSVIGDEVLVDDSALRLRQFTLSLHGQIPDGMLVRLSSIDANSESAWRMHDRFAAELARAVSPRYWSRVFGSLPAGAAPR